jgi:hypothetical protein
MHKQEELLGHTSQYLEYWVERAVQAFKSMLKYRTTAEPELVGVNRQLVKECVDLFRYRSGLVVEVALTQPRDVVDPDDEGGDGHRFVGSGAPTTENDWQDTIRPAIIKMLGADRNRYAQWHELDWEQEHFGKALLDTVHVRLYDRLRSESGDLYTSRSYTRPQERQDYLVLVPYYVGEDSNNDDEEEVEFVGSVVVYALVKWVPPGSSTLLVLRVAFVDFFNRTEPYGDANHDLCDRDLNIHRVKDYRGATTRGGRCRTYSDKFLAVGVDKIRCKLIQHVVPMADFDDLAFMGYEFVSHLK